MRFGGPDLALQFVPYKDFPVLPVLLLFCPGCLRLIENIFCVLEVVMEEGKVDQNYSDYQLVRTGILSCSRDSHGLFKQCLGPQHRSYLCF